MIASLLAGVSLKAFMVGSIAAKRRRGGGPGPLRFSATVFTPGTPSAGTILGATAGSTITAAALPPGLTINGAARTWAYDGSGPASASSFSLTEAPLSGSSRTTWISYAVGEVAPPPTGSDPTWQTRPATPSPVIVGQPALTTYATYSATPTSVDYTWELSNGEIFANPSDIFTPLHMHETMTLRRNELAHFAGHPDVAISSAWSAAIAARSIAGALSLTRVSALGASPLDYLFSLPVDGKPGDILEVQRSTDTAFGTIAQTVPLTLAQEHFDTPSSIKAAVTALGFTDPGSSEYLRGFYYSRLDDGTIVPQGGLTSSIIGKNYTPVVVRDNFDDGIVDTTLWGADANWSTNPVTSGTVNEVNGRLEITPSGTAGMIGRPTLNAAPFRGKFAQIERSIVSFNGSVITALRVGTAPAVGYQLHIGGGNVNLLGLAGGSADNLGGFTDTDYTGDVAPTAYAHFRIWNDYAAGVRDDIVVLTAPASASRPPAPGDWTEKIRVARSATYWNGTDNCRHALIGGQWTDNASAPLDGAKFDNYHTDAAL